MESILKTGQRSNSFNDRSIVDKELKCPFKNVEDEYIQSNRNELIECLKTLSLTDRRLLILYAELQSLRKVAKIYHCSEATIRNRLKDIKQKFQHLKSKKNDFI